MQKLSRPVHRHTAAVLASYVRELTAAAGWHRTDALTDDAPAGTPEPSPGEHLQRGAGPSGSNGAGER